MRYPLTITDGRPRHLQGRKQHDSLSRESLCPLRDESTLRESRRDERMPAARAELCRVELYHVVLMEVRTLPKFVGVCERKHAFFVQLLPTWLLLLGDHWGLEAECTESFDHLLLFRERSAR